MKIFSIIFSFFRDIFRSRNILYQLVIRDMKSQYIGSLLGFLWTFIQPSAITLVFMLVFGYGFKSVSPAQDVPFYIWFLCGYIPWLFFEGTLSANTNSILSFGYLVNKINFRVSIIPLIKLISNSVIFFIFLFIVFVLLSINYHYFTFFWFQVLYFYIAMFILLLGSSYLISSINVFIPDIGKANGIILQIGFFATPIIWDISFVSPSYQFLLKLNPMFYIVQGFRDSLINHEPLMIWSFDTLYFWCFTLVVVLIGVFVFSRLKPHFADVI